MIPEVKDYERYNNDAFLIDSSRIPPKRHDLRTALTVAAGFRPRLSKMRDRRGDAADRGSPTRGQAMARGMRCVRLLGRESKRLFTSVALVVGFAGPGFAQSLPAGGLGRSRCSHDRDALRDQPRRHPDLPQRHHQLAVVLSVGQGNAVAFQNGSGATLNRVTGNVPSRLDGTITATGSRSSSSIRPVSPSAPQAASPPAVPSLPRPSTSRTPTS